LVLFAAIYLGHLVIVSGFIGLGVACIISPLLNICKERWGMDRVLSLTLLNLLVFLALGLFSLILHIQFEDQFKSLVEKAPEVVRYLENLMTHYKGQYPKISHIFEEASYEDVVKSILNYLRKFVLSTAGAVSGLFLGTIIAFFAAVRSKEYFKAWVSLFPIEKQQQVKELSTVSAQALRKWFVTQAIDMLLIGGLTSLCLLLAGVKYWVVFGVATGLLCIIPYIGISSVLIGSSIITLAIQPDKFLWLVTVFLFTQFVEGNFILPYLMRKRVHLPAALLIFFMVIMGVWLGAIGVFISTPLLAVFLSLYRVRQAA